MADCYMAEIRSFAGRNTLIPSGWHLCDGSLLSIADYNALYSLLGTNFGGDGVTTFGLPDLRGRLPIGSGQGTGLTPRAFASKLGSETATLTADQTPAHTHAFTVTTAAATGNSPANMLYANPAPNIFYADQQTPGSQSQVLAADTVSNAGAGLPHENRMPSLAVNYIIALNGIFPSRP